jgi:hypothetical protein
MRRILAVLILLTVAAFWAACGEKSSAPNATKGNDTKAPTYSNSAPTIGAPSGGSSSNANAPTRIKPPTDK